MILKIDDFAQNRILVKELIRKKGANKYQEIASEFACVSGCPVFVVYYFMGELIGFNPWIVERMKSLSKFYQYTKIESKNDIGHSVELDKSQFL